MTDSEIQDWLDEHESPKEIGGAVMYVRSEHVLELFASLQSETLTKREAFAMAAMQGNLASPETAGANAQEIAQWSVYQADALLSELAKKQS
jgi:hypothetical protein